MSYILFKESFSYISGNRNPKKIPYVSGKGAFLCFGKGTFRTLTYLELQPYLAPWCIQDPRHIQTSTMKPFSSNMKKFVFFLKRKLKFKETELHFY